MSQDAGEIYGDRYLCSYCRGAEYRYRVDIAEVETGPRPGGQTAIGAGIRYCPECGAISRLLVEQVSIDLDGLLCEACHMEVDYEITFLWIIAHGGEFTFTAMTRCPACAHESMFRRSFDGRSRIRRVKLGPAGLELDLW
jgi:hypothetical protein